MSRHPGEVLSAASLVLAVSIHAPALALEAPHRGQQHRRYQPDTADPKDNRHDMNRAGKRYVVH
jgi:hypothetical protein